MNNEEILIKIGYPECNCGEMYKSRDMEDPDCHYHETVDAVKLAMDAARKDEALKAIDYVINHSTGKWYKFDAEELYEQFKKK